jgi:hypothetical protein
MTDHHPREIREAFLSSLTTSTKQKSKLGRDWVREGVVEISSSHGPGIWYVLPLLPYVVPLLLCHSVWDLNKGEGGRLAVMRC